MTDSVVVAADNRSLSLGLTGLDYDVLDLRPDEIDAWLRDGGTAVALVVGVERPADALEILNAVRTAHPTLPALLVASQAQGWSSVASMDDAQTSVLALPITRLSLVAAVQKLIAPPVEPPESSEADTHAVDVELSDVTEQLEVLAEPPPPSAPTPRPATGAATPEPNGSSASPEPEPIGPPAEPVRHMVAARSTGALRERLAHVPVEERHAAMPDGEPRPSAASVVEALRPAASLPTSPEAQAPVVTPVAAADAPHVRHYVQGVLAHLDKLDDVRDAALAVIEEILAASAATSGVVLLPDDGAWRVCGASGVRPLEWRYVVEADSWLVTTVVEGDRGVIIEDSDIARQRLGGAPLSHHPQLMAVPIARPRGLVLVARDAEPFNEDDLSATATIAADAGSLLVDALLVRDLARALSDYRGLDE